MASERHGRRLRLIGLLAAAVIAAGCTGTSGTATSAPSGQPVTLKVLFWHDEPVWMNEIKLFQEAYPWITVEYEAVPFGDFHAKMTAYVAAGDGPDVTGITTGTEINEFAQALQPIYDDLKDVLANLNATRSVCPNLDCSTNQYLGVPFSAQGFTVYYNKKVFTEVGLDPASGPSTWQALAEACDKVTAAGKSCFSVGAKDFGDDILFGAIALQTVTAEDWMGYTTGTSKYTSPNFVNALAIYQDMWKRGWFQSTLLEDLVYPGAQDLFTSGEAAFFPGLISDAYNWYSLGSVMDPEDIGVMALPPIAADFPLQGVNPGPLAGTIPADSSGASGPSRRKRRYCG